jgi:hypothetical protein
MGLFIGVDRNKKHSFIGWDQTIQLLVWVVIIHSGPDHFKSGSLWNYQTVGPQSGTGTARTVCLLWTSLYQEPEIQLQTTRSTTETIYPTTLKLGLNKEQKKIGIFTTF